ncbi:DNA-binding helix-turn-helix protein [Atopobium sp. BV3Ac4]|nr:DNA-binding helix-turn-helix protein [Atopobium sp. BV3Ac4]
MIGTRMTFGQAFVVLFNRSGITQADYARKTGLSTAYVALLANGKINNPTFDKACVIAEGIGVSLQDIVDVMRSPNQSSVK